MWGRIRDFRRLRLVVAPHPPPEGGERPPAPPGGSRRRRRIALALGILLVAFLATTQVTLKWRFYGLYLLTSESGRPLELKDDLLLGDGPRLLVGVSFSAVRELFSRKPEGGARLDVDWDAKEGGGTVTSVLAGGEVLQTVFGRYVDSDGATPRGLFVGGAIADVAATPAQNQSGMALRDARGWHHVWCNVNEALLIGELGRLVFPGEWRLTGSRVLVDAPTRVVIHSEHELEVGETMLRMERNVYFKAGRPFFRLGVNLMNAGDRPVHVSYAYGDEPWVGEFGSAFGNVGWTERGLVSQVTWLDAGAEAWAGIADTKSGVANFLSWEGSRPDGVYFGNHPGTPRPEELGAPLTSNEVFIGVEWRDRTIEPGETFSVRLTIGLAAQKPGGLPTFPAGAISPR
jgi:hypothetical protein